MDLLLEIKRFYEILTKHTNREAAKLEEIEAVAEEVFNDKWKVLTNEIKAVFSNEVIAELNEQLDKIKEIVANEKQN
jgi:16S rRNA A1518/A1519 N6-dimethyltransferase RsmA/KsgA/DIM1 with predicted DNA glycosylase/AP lyase activity